VEIPVGFGDMMARRPELALEWRYATREIFTSYFARGYAATDFVLEPDRRSGHYLRERRSTVPQG
jgi:predicted GNAT superfamily acetyltransferase